MWSMTSLEQQEKSGVVVDDNQITVQNFQTQDAAIVSYFAQLNPSERESKLEQVLKMGVLAIKSVGVESNLNYVDKAFDKLRDDFKDELDGAFGNAGPFSGLLDQHFGKDGTIIKDLFDPDKEGTPLHKLNTGLNRVLVEIRNEVLKKQGQEQVLDKSTQKGRNFEEQCKIKLDEIANLYSDTLVFTADKPGAVSKSKKGDFVLTINEIDKKIVFEMKDRRTISKPEIHQELGEAIENRGADYGIYVVKKRESLPNSVGWFNEYGNHLICAVESEDESPSAIDEKILYFAYKWARSRLVNISKETNKSLDPAVILEKVELVRKKVDDIKKIETQCTNIENASKTIRDTSKSTKKEIKQEIDDIIDSLKST